MGIVNLIKKKGTLSCENIKSTPIVFQNVLYRFEYIHHSATDDEPEYSYSRFVNVETGDESLPVAPGLEMTTVFVEKNKVYLYGIKNQSHIYGMESSDLQSWSAPFCAIGAAEWGVYNVSVCRSGDGYLMALQFAEPLWFVVVPFTIFFAESKDLKKWKLNFDAVFGRQKYADTPMLRYFDGWHYLFYVAGTFDSGFEECAVRSRDLRNWIHSPMNPILETSVQDRLIASRAFSIKELQTIQTAKNIDNSDLQMCQFGNRLYMTYVWGDQTDSYFLAEAEVQNMTEQAFCESCFPEC